MREITLELSSIAKEGLAFAIGKQMLDHLTGNAICLRQIVAMIKVIPDSPAAFPCGKWATIQSLEAQIDEKERETQ